MKKYDYVSYQNVTTSFLSIFFHILYYYYYALLLVCTINIIIGMIIPRKQRCHLTLGKFLDLDSVVEREAKGRIKRSKEETKKYAQLVLLLTVCFPLVPHVSLHFPFLIVIKHYFGH